MFLGILGETYNIMSSNTHIQTMTVKTVSIRWSYLWNLDDKCPCFQRADIKRSLHQPSAQKQNMLNSVSSWSYAKNTHKVRPWFTNTKITPVIHPPRVLLHQQPNSQSGPPVNPEHQHFTWNCYFILYNFKCCLCLHLHLKYHLKCAASKTHF